MTRCEKGPYRQYLAAQEGLQLSLPSMRSLSGYYAKEQGGKSLRDALIRPALPEGAAVADPGLVMERVCSKRQQG